MILKALASIHISPGARLEGYDGSVDCNRFFRMRLPVSLKHLVPAFSPRLIECSSVISHSDNQQNSQSTEQIEAVLTSVREGNIDAVILAVKNGFDIKSTDSESWNSLHWATEMGHQTLVIRLLDIDPLLLNSKTREGLSAINIAAWRGDKSMVELLISQGAEIDDKTKWGETPLHHAVTFGHTKVCETLLASGADPLAEDKLKRTPYQIAMQRGSEKMKDLFRRYGKQNQ